jgi:uncharacterized protein (TIGR02246 family)
LTLSLALEGFGDDKSIHRGGKLMKRVLMASVFLLGLTGLSNAADLTLADAQRIYQPLADQFIQSFKAKQPEKMAAVFTDDGWRITDNGPVIGKEALLKHFEAVVKVFDLSNAYVDQVKVLDNENIQATGRWEGTLKLPKQPPRPMAGFWVVTATQKEGNWKWAMEGFNVKMPPPPNPKTQ